MTAAVLELLHHSDTSDLSWELSGQQTLTDGGQPGPTAGGPLDAVPPLAPVVDELALVEPLGGRAGDEPDILDALDVVGHGATSANPLNWLPIAIRQIA